jgi:hypothetical protein
VIWFQAFVCFGVWVAYGFWLRRLSADLRSKALARRGRFGWSVLLMVGAMALMLGGLLAVQALGGVRDRAMVPWAWLAVTVLGVGFVHMQTLAAVSMTVQALARDNNPADRPSVPQEPSQP